MFSDVGWTASWIITSCRSFKRITSHLLFDTRFGCLKEKAKVKVTRATAILVVVLIGAFVFSGVNTYLLFDKNRMLQEQLNQTRDQLQNQVSQLQSLLQSQLQAEAGNLTSRIDILNATSHLPVEEYDFIIFQKDGLVQAKNGTTGKIDFSSADAAAVINQALIQGNNVYIKSGEYTLSSDIMVLNKKNARIDGDAATILGNGHKIVIKGDNYTRSQYNHLSGIDLINGTVRVENSFRTTITNLVFEKSVTALELVNSDTWTEGTQIQDCLFQESTENIVFRTPIQDSINSTTGSYSSSQISRCFFRLLDNSVAVKVEPNAEFSDSQMQDIRIWIGENGQNNQTGLAMNGSMYKTVLTGVVFESFASQPLDNSNLYAMTIGKTADQMPILAGGVSFLGNWTARINNPYSKWIYGFGSAFKQENTKIPVGTYNQYGPQETINTYPATLTSFRARIQVQGSFSNNETITVRIRLEFVDNTVTTSMEKTFTNSTTLWLSDDDLLQLFPSQNIIWAIQVDAKTTSATTDTNASIDIYGVTT
jgi:hypothetical protein